MTEPTNKDNGAQPGAVAVNTPPRRRPTLARSRQFGSGRDDILSKRSLLSGESGSLHSVGSSSLSSSRSLRAIRPPSRRVSSGGEGVAARLRRENSTREGLITMRRSMKERDPPLKDIENGGQHEIAIMRLVPCDAVEDADDDDVSIEVTETTTASPSLTAPRVGVEKAAAFHPVMKPRMMMEGDKVPSPPKSDEENQYSNSHLLLSTETLRNPTEHLVEARLVNAEEEEDYYITEAAPIDPNDFAKAHSSNINPKYVRMLRFLGAGLLVAGVVIVALAATGVFSPPNDSSMAIPPTSFGGNLDYNNETKTDDASDEWALILPAYTLEALLDDDTAPQARAYQWLRDDPNLQNYTQDRALQRFALATFYYATMGENWFLSNDWLSHDTHECDWYSAFSDDQDTNNGEQVCDTLGTYQALVLAKNQLSGSIPAEVSLLTSLTQFRMNNNLLQATLPTEIGLLTLLEQLEVQTNWLEGSLPSEVGLLTELRILWTGKNGLGSTLPTSLGLVSELQSLSIGMNYFSGHIPSELGLLTQLQVCTMDLNFLSGPIPSELSLATRLNALKVSTNELTGRLPSELLTLTHLEFLDVASNFLSGRLPFEIHQMTQLRDFIVYYNGFSGSIPSLVGLLSRLEVLDLQYNAFSGTLPVELVSMDRLERLYVRGNENLYGTLPSELTALEHLSGISISETLVSGTVPLELCDMDINMTCSDFLCGCDCECTENTEDNPVNVDATAEVPLITDDIPFS